MCQVHSDEGCDHMGSNTQSKHFRDCIVAPQLGVEFRHLPLLELISDGDITVLATRAICFSLLFKCIYTVGHSEREVDLLSFVALVCVTNSSWVQAPHHSGPHTPIRPIAHPEPHKLEAILPISDKPTSRGLRRHLALGLTSPAA